MDKGEQVRYRRDINHIEKHQKDLFKQYHILMRLLHVFEAPNINDRNGFIYYYLNQDQQSQVEPKCMYDSLVSMHANSCEHGIQFFAYWHRWLQSKLESYFLQAEKILLKLTREQSKVEAARLYQLVKSKFSSPDQIANKLWEVRSHYIEVWERLGKPRFIGAHYWNLMDFNNVITYPKGFKNRQEVKNYPEIIAADDLIELIWEQDGIYEINLRTRYNYQIKKIQSFQIQSRPEDQKNFDAQLKYMTSQVPIMRQLVENTNFWKNPSQQQWKNNYQTVQNLLWYTSSFYAPLRQTYQRQTYIKQKNAKNTYSASNNIRFNVLSQNQVDFIFGGANHPYYYDKDIEKYRKQEFSGTIDFVQSKNQKENQKQISQKVSALTFAQMKQTRNQTIPYWTFGGNLKTVASQFLTQFSTKRSRMGNNTMETLHDFAHMNQGYPINDGSFSIMSPIFFAYHGFIDLVLETKIIDIKRKQPLFTPKIGEIQMKTDNRQEYAVENIKQFLASPIPSEAHRQFKSFRWLWSQDISKRQKNRIIKFSQYPIFQYSNRSTLQSKEADWKDHLGQKFTYERLMLNDDKKTLRDNYDLKKVRYDVESSGFHKNCIQIYNQSRNVYVTKQQSFVIQLSINRKKMVNQSFFVRLIWNNQVIAQQYIAFFEIGKDCPNCQKQETKNVKIYFPLFLLKKYLKNMDKNAGKSIRVETTALSQIKGKIIYNRSAVKQTIPQQYYGGTLTLILQQETPDKNSRILKSKKYDIPKFNDPQAMKNIKMNQALPLFLFDESFARYKKFRFMLKKLNQPDYIREINIKAGSSWIQFGIQSSKYGTGMPVFPTGPAPVFSLGPRSTHSGQFQFQHIVGKKMEQKQEQKQTQELEQEQGLQDAKVSFLTLDDFTETKQ